MFLPILEVRKLKHREFTLPAKRTQLVRDGSTFWLQTGALNYDTVLPDLSFHVLLSKARILSILSRLQKCPQFFLLLFSMPSAL